METTPLNCNSCGAPLEVGPGTNFVTCGHCGARLAVKRTASSAYTELLEKLDRKTDAIADRLDEIARQNEVERIDREWEQERQQYLRTDKYGGRHEPNAVVGAVVAVFMVAFGLFWTAMAYSAGGGCFGAFGLLFVALVVFAGIKAVTNAGKYVEAKARYEKRRAAALAGEREPGSPPPPG